MSVINFVEEFNHLIMRYTTAMTPNSKLTKDVIVPLTYDQITNAIHQVYSALGIKDYDDKSNDSIKTPFNGVTTPAVTPVASKINESTPRSQDVLSSVTNASIVSDKSLNTNEKEAESSANVSQTDKKNPIICVNNVSRSDTFVREKKQETQNDEEDNDVFENNFTNTETSDSLYDLLQYLNEMQNVIMVKMDDIKKKITKQRIRHLPSSNNSPGFNRTSSMIKTKLPTKIRRSSSAFSGTPTSSRSFALGNENTVDRRKSIGGNSIYGAASSGKLSESKNLGRSISTLNLTSSTVSPGSVPKLTKNPKYAHVQSTIPKPSQIKKKVIATKSPN